MGCVEDGDRLVRGNPGRGIACSQSEKVFDSLLLPFALQKVTGSIEFNSPVIWAILNFSKFGCFDLEFYFEVTSQINI